MMRSIFGFIIATFLVLGVFVDRSPAQLNDFDRQEFTFENALAGKNPGFESGTVQWTASGGTFVVNSGTQIVPNSKQFATWDSNSAGQTLQTAAVTVPKTGNCEFSIWIAVPSGTATHTITVTDGTNDLVTAQTITNNTNALKHIVNFPCPSSGTVRGKLTSVASNEPSVSLDNARLGTATNVGVADLITEATAFTPTGSLTTNATYTGRRWRVGDRFRAEMTVSFSGTNTQGELTFNLPSDVVIDTSKLTLGTSSSNYSIGSEGQVIDSGSNQYFIFPYYKTTTTVGVRYRRVPTAGTPGLQDGPNVDTSTNSPITVASGDSFTVKVDLPVVGWAASQVVMPDAQGLSWSGLHAATCIWTTTSTSYADPSDDASCTLTERTNRNFGTVVTYGAAKPGITFTPKKSGTYFVCARSALYNSTANGYSTMQLSATGGTSATIANGGIRQGTSSGSNDEKSVTLCGLVNLTSATSTTIRLQIATSAAGTTTLADLSAGGASVEWSIFNVDQPVQAILANSVSTQVANGLKIESAKLTTTTGPNACAITSQFGTWLTGTPSSSGAGQCSFAIVTGTFSSAPYCNFTVYAGGSAISATGNASSATAGSFQIWDALGAGTTGSVVATCIGPR